MESKNLYISDTHFGHKNILHYDNRPFKSIEEMEKQMIDNWVNRVTDDNNVYILGDFCWKGKREWVRILEQLPGHKILIHGNHDPKHLDWEIGKHIMDLGNYAEIRDNGRDVVLCHYPIVCYKNHYHGWYHLYGHVHNAFESNMMEHDKMLMRELYEKDCRMFNVGCMMPWMGYTPRSLDEIIQRCK